MKHRTTLALALVASLFSISAVSANDEQHASMQTEASAPDTAMTDGEVKKVDKDAGKIMIKHGALTNLDMPPMTMVFRVADQAMLDQIKTGDKIHFLAEKKNGALTVTKLETAK